MVKYKMRTVDWTVKWNVKWLEPTTLWSELQTCAIRVDILVPPFNNSCCIKTFTTLPQKSDMRDAEFGERPQSHLLRFGQCLQWEKLGAHDFSLELSSHRACLKFTQQSSQLSVPIRIARFVHAQWLLLAVCICIYV